MVRSVGLLGLLVAASLAVPAAASAETPIHYISTGITAGSRPGAITGGPDGDVWFTEPGIGAVARVTPNGTVTEFSEGIHGRPQDITTGSDGNVWFTERDADRVARITPHGTVTEFSAGVTPDSHPTGIASGPDGNVWFTESSANQVAKVSPTGSVTQYPITSGVSPDHIAAAADGRLWFTALGALDGIKPDGSLSDGFGYTPYNATDLAPGPGHDMALGLALPLLHGSDVMVSLYKDLGTLDRQVPLSAGGGGMARDSAGDLWVPEGNDRIMRIQPAGAPAEFRSDAAVDAPIADSTGGPDGRMWLTQPSQGRIGVFDPQVALPPIDVVGPAISVATPTQGARYTQGAAVSVAFACADDASPLMFCGADSGPDALQSVSCFTLSYLPREYGEDPDLPDRSGDRLDTAALGPHRFTSAGIDVAGNLTCTERKYTVRAAAKPGGGRLPNRFTLHARLARVGHVLARALRRGGERKLARRHVLHVRLHWPAGGRLTVAIRHTRLAIAHGSRRLNDRGTATLALRIKRKGRRLARAARRHDHRLSLSAHLRFHATGGPTVTRRARVTLKG